MTYKDKALEIIDRLKLNGYVNNRERGVLRRALLEERPTGEWLNHNSYFKRCSLCKKVVGFDYIEQEGERFKYCPNCGADMRGGRE